MKELCMIDTDQIKLDDRDENGDLIFSRQCRYVGCKKCNKPLDGEFDNAHCISCNEKWTKGEIIGFLFSIGIYSTVEEYNPKTI